MNKSSARCLCEECVVHGAHRENGARRGEVGLVSKYTPGPWSFHRAPYPVDGEFDCAIRAGGQMIAETFGRSGETSRHDSEANARLIAAAPEMLEALKLAREAIDNEACRSTGSNMGNRVEDLIVCPGCRAINAVNAVIAKAEGTS